MILAVSDESWQTHGVVVLSERITSGSMAPHPGEKLN